MGAKCARPSASAYRRLFRELEANGFRIYGGGRRHYTILHPDGQQRFTLSASPARPEVHANWLHRIVASVAVTQ